MVKLNWNPDWQLDPPAVINFNADGSVTFEGPVGRVFLPQEYTEFMLQSEGAALRDKGSYFVARFPSGPAIFEIEWLGSMRNVMLGTWAYYERPEPETFMLPPGYVFIGYAEPGPIDVVICADRNSGDFGKVYAWPKANDPWMTGDNMQGLGHITDSFNAFMNGLTQKENL